MLASAQVRMASVALLVAFAAATASADLTLTGAGAARGFKLTTFASGFSSNGIGAGPVAIDYQENGTVLVSSAADNNIRRFQNADDQLYSSAPAISYPTSEFPHGIAHLGSRLFVSHFDSQRVVELNADGSVKSTVVSNVGQARQLLTDNTRGRLITSTVQGVRIINPDTGAFTTLVNQEADGISLSSDGNTLYGAMIGGAHAGHLIGFSMIDGSVVYDSGFVGGGLDGTALGFGQFNGYIYGNLNNGTVLEFDLANPGSSPIVIASGGSRGDFVCADPSGSGDLLLTQSDRVMRLSGIPGPSALALLGLGGLVTTRRRR